MLRVYRSETEQYVVIHEPSQSVVLADTFDEAYARLRERLGDRFDEETASPPAAAASARSRRPQGAARYGLLVLLTLLPFVWLGVLHVSLGGLVVELRRSLHPDTKATASGAVQAELDRMGRQIDRLSGDVAKLHKPDPPRGNPPPAIADDPDNDDNNPAPAELKPPAEPPADTKAELKPPADTKADTKAELKPPAKKPVP